MLRVALVLFLALFCLPEAAWAFWPQFKYAPDHSGAGLYEGADKGELKWRLDVKAVTGFVNTPIIGKDGALYVIGRSGKAGAAVLYEVSPAGEVLRSHEFPTSSQEPLTTPALSPDGVTLYYYTAAKDGRYSRGIVTALSLKDWKAAWELRLDRGTVNAFTPITVGWDGTVYVGTSDYSGDAESPSGAALWAVSPAGKVVWVKRFTVLVSSPAVSRDGREIFIYTADEKGNLMAVALDRSGGELWRFNTSNFLTNYVTPVVGADGYLFVPAEKKTILAVRSVGGGEFDKRRFETSYAVDQANPSISASGNVYADVGGYHGDGGAIVSFDTNGKMRWKFQIKHFLASAPLIDRDENVYFLAGDGYLYKLNSNGRKKWRFKVSPGGENYGTAPSMGSDGTVYIVGGDGALYAIGGK